MCSIISKAWVKRECPARAIAEFFRGVLRLVVHARLGCSGRRLRHTQASLSETCNRVSKSRDHIGRRIERADRWFTSNARKRPRFHWHPSAPSEYKTKDTNQPETTRKIPPFQNLVSACRSAKSTTPLCLSNRGREGQTYLLLFRPRRKKFSRRSSGDNSQPSRDGRTRGLGTGSRSERCFLLASAATPKPRITGPQSPAPRPHPPFNFLAAFPPLATLEVMWRHCRLSLHLRALWACPRRERESSG
jgi:hypothetical protein